MTPDWQSWLPDNVVPPPGVMASLDMLVRQWSERWFERHAFTVRRPIRRAVSGRPMTAAHSILHDDGLAISMSGSGSVLLGALALDLPSDLDWTPADQSILQHVGSQALEDFNTGLIKWSVAESPRRGDGEAPKPRPAAWEAEIGTPLQVPAIRLQWSDACMAGIIKRALPPLNPAPLGKPALALAKTPVSVGAFAGRSRFTLADLRSLNPGDTVMLDRDLSRPLEFVVEGNIDPGRPCRLTGSAAQAMLAIA